jgi:glycosyltransferase involved in cell wall biosynthesis
LKKHDLKILFIAPEGYGGFGGISVYNIDMLDALCELPFVKQITFVPRLIREQNPQVPDKVEMVSQAVGGLRNYTAAIAMLAKRRFDLVICTHIYLLPFARLATMLRPKTPVHCVLYGIEAWQPTRRLLVDRLVKKCDKIISISRFTADRFRNWSNVPPEKLTILPNCVHAERYGAGAKPPYLLQRYGLSDRRVIVTLGRLDARERQKGMDELIDVLPLVLKEAPDVRCVIAGDGDDRPRLEQKVKAAALSDKIVFAGRISEDEKADHYRLADVFSMAGRQEGFGFVFLEALACGIPVVASALDGSRDAVLDGRLGELANPNDLQSLKESLLKALNKPKGVPDDLSHFSFANFTKRLGTIVAGE